jgi:TatA/E family protein of Tat protein translocase
MLGVGMQEMLIIGIAALLIFGPGKLPEVMGQAGKLYRDFRNMTSELTGEFEKTVAEAKDAASSLTGDLGGMQKQVNSVTASVKRDLGTGSKVTNTSSLKKTNGSSTTAKKTVGTAASSSKSTTSSTRSTASSSTKSSRTTSSSTSTSTSTVAKKPVTPVATKEDPFADVSMFEPVAPERVRRARKATPSIITDPTPRSILSELGIDDEPQIATQATVAADDPLARARQRRRNAGYAQRSA